MISCPFCSTSPTPRHGRPGSPCECGLLGLTEAGYWVLCRVVTTSRGDSYTVAEFVLRQPARGRSSCPRVARFSGHGQYVALAGDCEDSVRGFVEDHRLERLGREVLSS